jgi:AcrR family transcriptional regulator
MSLALGPRLNDLTVGLIVAAAGVSRRTFYEHFEDREECVACALAPMARQLLEEVHREVAGEHPQDALDVAIRALLAYAEVQPAHARLLLSDVLGGGGRLRDQRRRLLDEAARVVENARAGLPADAILPSLPVRLILAVVCRMTASRLGRGECGMDELRAGLPAWVLAYESRSASRRWRSQVTVVPPARSPFLPATALRAPRACAPGHPRAQHGELAESQWLQIVFATAEIVQRDGLEATTVAQITAAAGVDSRAFYRLFTGKQQALAGAMGLLFRHAMAAAAGAFVAGETWPERVWEAARVLTQYAERNPTLAHGALLESPMAGAGEGQHVDELTLAFTIFLREGQTLARAPCTGSSRGPSELALEAIGTAVFELGRDHVREHGAARLSCLLGQVVFISLAPFLGAEAAHQIASSQAPEREPAELVSVA